MNTKSVAIIPARGGSKRIYKKNIKKFLGTPIICRVIEKLISFDMFDGIIVTTDDDEIINVVKKYEDVTVLIRPHDLSDDYATTLEVISHAVKSINDREFFPEYICCIYPCAVFLKKEDLLDGLQKLYDNEVNFTYPVTEYAHPIQRAITMDGNGFISMYDPKYELIRTQDLNKTYHDVGQFYWGTSESWLRNDRLHSNAAGICVPSERYIDIDTENDWVRAEKYFECYEGKDG